MTITLKFDLPDEVLSTMRESPDGFIRQMRLAAAVKWYELGRISQGKAAQVSGLSREEFIGAMSGFGVSPFQCTPDELDREIDP